MSFTAKEPSSQLKERYHGVAEFQVLKLQPTTEEREGYGWGKTEEFKGYKDEEKNTLRIVAPLYRKEEDILTSVSFYLKNQEVPTSEKEGNRSLYIDIAGNFKWLSTPEFASGKDFVKPFKDKKGNEILQFQTGTARRAYQGEQEFTQFMRAWLRDPEECRISDMQALFNQDYTELRDIQSSNTILVPLGIIMRDTPEGSVPNYRVYSKAFADSWGNSIASTWGKPESWNTRIQKMMGIINNDLYNKADFGTTGEWRIYTSESVDPISTESVKQSDDLPF